LEKSGRELKGQLRWQLAALDAARREGACAVNYGKIASLSPVARQHRSLPQGESRTGLGFVANSTFQKSLNAEWRER
jgi:hypothetical protein